MWSLILLCGGMLYVGIGWMTAELVHGNPKDVYVLIGLIGFSGVIGFVLVVGGLAGVLDND